MGVADAPVPICGWQEPAGQDEYGRGLVWVSSLDQRYQVEVQRIEGSDRGRLLVFDHEADNDILLDEEVGLSYGARFGPDAMDVQQWQERVTKTIDALAEQE